MTQGQGKIAYKWMAPECLRIGYSSTQTKARKTASSLSLFPSPPPLSSHVYSRTHAHTHTHTHTHSLSLSLSLVSLLFIPGCFRQSLTCGHLASRCGRLQTLAAWSVAQTRAHTKHSHKCARVDAALVACGTPVHSCSLLHGVIHCVCVCVCVCVRVCVRVCTCACVLSHGAFTGAACGTAALPFAQQRGCAC